MGSERRQDARLSLSRSIKMRLASGPRYLTGRTCNLSPRGALVELHRAAPLQPGEQVEVRVFEPHERGVVPAEAFTPARILRQLRHGDHQYVALSFEPSHHLAATG